MASAGEGVSLLAENTTNHIATRKMCQKRIWEIAVGCKGILGVFQDYCRKSGLFLLLLLTEFL